MNPQDDADIADQMPSTDKRGEDDPYYTADLVKGQSDDMYDNPEDTNTDLGGTIDRQDVMDADNDGSIAGLPGHPGIDEDTG